MPSRFTLKGNIFLFSSCLAFFCLQIKQCLEGGGFKRANKMLYEIFTLSLSLPHMHAFAWSVPSFPEHLLRWQLERVRKMKKQSRFKSYKSCHISVMHAYQHIIAGIRVDAIRRQTNNISIWNVGDGKSGKNKRGMNMKDFEA